MAAAVDDLVVLKADLSRIPEHELRQIKGLDGQKYYKICYQILITFFSASAKAELIYKGVNYGSVDMEWL